MGTSNIFVGGKELANYTSSTDKLSLTSSVDFPTGHIIQIVSQLYTSAVTVSSSSYQDAGPSLAITPSSTSTSPPCPQMP